MEPPAGQVGIQLSRVNVVTLRFGLAESARPVVARIKLAQPARFSTDPQGAIASGKSGRIAPSYQLVRCSVGARIPASPALALRGRSRVRAVAAKAGAKLNDVVLAMSSGVLRRHLLSQDALPAKSLTAFVPISTRDASDTTASNQVIGMICLLGTDVEDPKKRLETIFAESARSKELWSPLRHLMPLVRDTVALGSPIAIQMLSLLYGRSNLANVLPPAVTGIIGTPARVKALNCAWLKHFTVR